MFVIDSKLCKTILSLSSFNCVTCLLGESIFNCKVKAWETNITENKEKGYHQQIIITTNNS